MCTELYQKTPPATAEHNTLARKSPPWLALIRSPTGYNAPRNVPKAEREAIAMWLLDLEHELDHPATPQDHAILGALGQQKLIQMRLAREAFRTTKSKGGEIRQSVSELRQVTKLIIDMLGRLRFKSPDAVATPDIRDVWNQGRENATQGDDNNTDARVDLADGGADTGQRGASS